MLKPEGFDEAILGVGAIATVEGPEIVLVYDLQIMADILIARDEMDREDAIEFLMYNVVDAYMGETGPCFVNRVPAGMTPESLAMVH